MTDPMKPDDPSALELYFNAAREAGPTPDQALMQRILDDAASVQAARTQARTSPASRPAFWPFVAESLGGWRGLSALAACACAGLWIGFATPDLVDTYSGGLLAADDAGALDFADVYGFEDMLTEG